MKKLYETPLFEWLIDNGAYLDMIVSSPLTEVGEDFGQLTIWE